MADTSLKNWYKLLPPLLIPTSPRPFMLKKLNLSDYFRFGTKSRKTSYTQNTDTQTYIYIYICWLIRWKKQNELFFKIPIIFRHVVFLKSFLYIYVFEYKNLRAGSYCKENFKNHEPESCKKSKICLLIDNFNIVRWQSLLSMSFTSITANLYFLFMALQNFAM